MAKIWLALAVLGAEAVLLVWLLADHALAWFAGALGGR